MSVYEDLTFHVHLCYNTNMKQIVCFYKQKESVYIMYKIDKNKPIPDSKYGTGMGKYPWHELESGDSFFVTIDGMNGSKSRPATPLFKTKSRVVIENDKKGYRVWRV